MNKKIQKIEEEMKKLEGTFVNVEKYGTSRAFYPLKELARRNKLLNEKNKLEDEERQKVKKFLLDLWGIL